MDKFLQLVQQKIRKAWHRDEWHFSVVDVVAVLTEQDDFKRAKSYWTTLKNRLKNEGSQLVTKCDQLKMTAQDGKMRLTDVANTKTILRLIQSIPSKKAEPLKMWLAKVGTERVAEINDPSIGVDRARGLWQKYGRSKKWIEQRMMGQEVRNKLTDYWKDADVKEGQEFALLTNIIHHEWTDMNVQDHTDLKNLGRANNLRDHMNEAELILTALAEMSTRHIAESVSATGLEENKIPAHKGGRIAKNARLELESKTGKKVVTSKNFLSGSNDAKLL